MKILSAEETSKITPLNKGRQTLVYAKLLQLQIGEGLHIEKQEWKAKYRPSALVNKAGKRLKRKFICRRMPDGSGWLVKREG
jgi:hypothetical protein